jgi:glycosyltransferase involved in cell wall biosynthesis
VRSGERIQVAMVHGPATPDHDGVSDYVAHLLPALARVGVEAVPVPVRPEPSTAWMSATAAVARVVRQLRPDLVHVQFAPAAYRFSVAPGLLPLLLPRRTRLVTTVHEYGWWAAPGWVPNLLWRPLELTRWWDRETGRLVPASVVVVATDPGHAAQLRRRTGKRPVEVPIAPNVDGRSETRRARLAARREVRKRYGLAPEAPVVVFFGFVHPVKGLRYLIEALPALRRTRPRLHLLVVGGLTSQALPEPAAEALHRELAALAERHGVAEAVTFTGHLPAEAASEALHAADAAVLPFTAGVTSKSGALLSTLAHELPTAVTVPDEPDDRLRDGETVAVIPARRDPAAITRTLDRVLTDVCLRERLIEGGRRLAARHSWPLVAAAHRAVYERVLGPGDE